MNKHLFYKYVWLLLGVCFLAFGALAGFLHLYTAKYFRAQREADRENAAQNVNQSVTTMMKLTQQDFRYLLEKEKELLFDTLYAQSGDQTDLFITDGQGTVVVSLSPEQEGKSLSPAVMTESTKMAREGDLFQTDLGGFFEEERLCRVLLLEKEYPDSHTQRVGAVFLSLPDDGETYLSGLLFSFWVASCLVLFFLTLSFFFITRSLVRPLRLLSDAAASFAGGDFSPRLPEKEGGEMTPLFRAFNQMAQRVEENEKVRQTFVSNVSHDLRTPLTTIGGFIQNMAEGTIPPEKSGHYYQIILGEVNRLSRLVQRLLETSRLSAGEKKYDFAPMDLCELARQTLLSFETRLENKKMDVDFVSEEDSIFVLADRDAIWQVIYNLIDNAVKFTPDGGKISLRVSTQASKAIFCVENRGEDIPEEELKNLFDRFYKSDRSRSLDQTGLGLGLFIVKTILSAHGEEVWVESKKGEFTRFFFSLPLTARPGRGDAPLPFQNPEK